MTDWLFHGDYGVGPLNFPILILGLLLAFACGQVVAWVYMTTHSGLSYSRSFTNALVLMPILVALVMQIMNNNLVTAFGLMAIFAIVRFRNILRDTLDTCYVLSVIVLGIACGTEKFSTALIGCVVIVSVMVGLWYISFGNRHRFDLILNMHWSRLPEELDALQRLLDRHSLKTYCASQHSSREGVGADLCYRVLLRDPSRAEELLDELRKLNGISRVTSIKADEESEI